MSTDNKTPTDNAKERAGKNREQVEKLKQAAASKPTYASIAAMINQATTESKVTLAVSHADDLPEDQQNELRELAINRLAMIVPVTDAPASEEVAINAQPSDIIPADKQPPEATKAPATIKDALLAKMPQVETLLPRHITPERFMRITFMAIQKNPDLLDCTRQSLLESVLRSAEWGLVPDGRQGALVPFNNSKKVGNEWVKTKEATFLPMYQGLIQLARNSGEIADIFPATVYENDDFEYELGLNRKLMHKPSLRSDRGKPIAYYCVIELKDGSKTFGPGPMTVAEVERVRSFAKSKNSPAWNEHFEAQAWKTVIKRNLKFAPKAAELADAIAYDNDSDFGGEIDLGSIELEPSNDIDDINQELLEAKAS